LKLLLNRRNFRERKREHYYRRAKREGFRSRSAYKLLQISKRFHLIKSGFVVVDLGCAPGGWLQVSSQLVGERGYVLGVDKRRVNRLQKENVKILQADVREPETVDLIIRQLPREADVVLSDLAPNVTGNWQIDHLRQIDLARAALYIAKMILRRGGRFLTKVFQGEKLEQFTKELEEDFSKVRIVKPAATRKRSAEAYLLATRFVGRESTDRLQKYV